MSYQHTVLDFYDDGGRLLKEMLPQESIPEIVKSAQVIQGRANNNQYALVLLEDGETMGKFATADAGNSWISAAYFAKTRHLLPVEAQKVAAANISKALENWGLKIPHQLSKMAGDFLPKTNIVNVTGKSAPKIVRETATDIDYALELADGTKKYPLDNAESVKTALSYFELNHGQFVPRQRREYAVKVASVATKHGIPLNDAISKYAGTGYNRALLTHLKVRKGLVDESGAQELQKLASRKADIAPEEFVNELADFDVANGISQHWDSYLADPWFATFEKVAKGAVESITFQIGNDVVTEQDLMNLKRVHEKLISSFGHEFAMNFYKDPITFFSALPLPQKKVVGAMARDITSRSLY
tara:strand:+ start:271 stop:1344 length:1074 start_codon:yes stop_codon:yes gene_type:complete